MQLSYLLANKTNYHFFSYFSMSNFLLFHKNILPETKSNLLGSKKQGTTITMGIKFKYLTWHMPIISIHYDGRFPKSSTDIFKWISLSFKFKKNILWASEIHTHRYPLTSKIHETQRRYFNKYFTCMICFPTNSIIPCRIK